MKQDLTIDEMWTWTYQSENYTMVFCTITRRNSIRAKINNINRKIYIISKYLVFFGLTDNLIDVFHENTSLVQDSVVEDEASSGENDK